MRKGLAVLLALFLPGAALAGPGEPVSPSARAESGKITKSTTGDDRAESPDGRAAELEEIRKSQLPDLPVWSPSDYERVKKGEIVAGQHFFAPAPVDPEAKIDRAVVELPEPVEETEETGEYETVVSPEHLAGYFKELPVDEQGGAVFLSDPQQLLAQQEFRDREIFLQYHSSESNIDMHVYLFDQQQELPEGTDLATVYQELFAGHGPIALLFYHLGAPDRAQFLLSPQIRAVISQDEQDRALKAAVEAALEKSDFAYQLDNFLVELSIRLYWIERELKVAKVTREARRLVSENGISPAVNERVEDSSGPMGRVFILVFGVVAFGLSAWGVWMWRQARRKYVFPEVDCGPLLGAPHAAGVGAVISFSNAHLPPSRQRDEIPDYLQRM